MAIMRRLTSLNRKRRAGLAAALALLVAAPAAIWVAQEGNSARLMQQTEDAINDFLDRSPGERSGTTPLKVKGNRALGPAVAAAGPGPASAGTPEQRALGKIFPEIPDLPAENGPTSVIIPDSAGPPTIVTPPGTPNGGFPGGPGTGGYFPAPPPSGGGTGGGGGGTPGGGGETPTPPPPPPPSAVPEPSTWMLLILGFFLTGGTLRRRIRAAAPQGRSTAFS